MVEADERLRDEEAALRQSRAGVGQPDGRLEPRDVVVGEVADDRFTRPLGLLERAEPRPGADEREAAEPAALHRLEQEARAALAPQPQVRAEGRDEVGCELRRWRQGTQR